MNSVGIDVSKGKSMIAVMRPFGEIVVTPYEVCHTDSDLSELIKLLRSLDGETRIIMESTGSYHTPIAWALYDAGFYVSVVNAMLVHDYKNNSLRRVKTDKKDAIKLANYGLDQWLKLPRYVPVEDTRLMLKNCYRQYQQYSKVQTMLKNNLISLLDTAFPNVNRLFTSPPRDDGSEKWVSWQLSGIVNVSVECPRKLLLPSIKSGVTNTVTALVEIRPLVFTQKHADIFPLCPKPIQQNFW